MTHVTIAPRTRSLGLKGMLSDGTVLAYDKLSATKLKEIESNLRRNYSTYFYKAGQATLEQVDYFYRGCRLVAVYIPDDWNEQDRKFARQYHPSAWDGVNDRFRFIDGLTDGAGEVFIRYAGLQPLDVETAD